MRPLSLLPLILLSVTTLSAQTFKLPNGVQETFGEEWIVESSGEAAEQSVSRARWKTGDGPDVSFQKIDKSHADSLKDEQHWLPIALADEGLKVRDVQAVNEKDLGATLVRRYVCEDGQKRQIIVETGSQPIETGAFRVMIRHPEKMDPKATELTAAIKARHFVKTDVKSSSLFDRVFSLGTPESGATESASDSGEYVKAHRSAMVIVADQAGGGSGFICHVEGRPMLITNIHVAASSPNLRLTSIDGEAVRPGRAFAAVGRDIMALEATAVPGILEMHPAVDEVRVGDPIFVLGNSGAAGVVHPVEGKVVGMGPELVEVDAPFVPGNSGSPVIHKATGKVIGVATYLTIESDELGANGPREMIRRFSYRLDGIKSWQPVEWRAFYGEHAKAATVRALTESLTKFIRDVADDGRLNPGLHQNPAIRTYVQVWQKDHRANLSGPDARRANTQLARFMKSASERDINEALQTLKYDYFLREVKQDALVREKMTRIFQKLGEY